MKINLSEDRLLLVGTLLPSINPYLNYAGYQRELDRMGMVLGEYEDPQIWDDITQVFQKIEVHGMTYVVIGHVLSNSEKKGSWQTIYLVKEELFYQGNWAKFMGYFPKED